MKLVTELFVYPTTVALSRLAVGAGGGAASEVLKTSASSRNTARRVSIVWGRIAERMSRKDCSLG